ncbi:Acetyl-CoA:oxalate CoA-transferase [Saezia sanguinis]|uniref:Acetyl-CoA:oxalate CoA-transferase n=1 Tax=Saezia sanguinis TaxID=1965230 RepID=A0A433SBJ0_9BURK|nr:CaiB/BaiF CoA-transferase family protein [Saezia sanguinis]RUS66093.1 Acetyl-CoA:oxalate CoA-transferase [Saezia sanguinis]
MTTSTAASGSALAGLRVLDLSRILAGPWCTQILADLGADVIKIERPKVGDDTRQWGPPFIADENGDPTQLATYFLCCNRNKRSVAVDISTPEGQKLISELAKQSDIVVENYKVGGLKQYGLDYESLQKLNPRLIYCSITGFGQTGPYAPRAGYDLLIQASGGLMSITGQPDDAPGGGPMRTGVAVIDILTGIYASTAILAAVESRHKTGKGQYVDMALLDVSTAILANQVSAYLNAGRDSVRQGNSHPSIVPYQTFPTADGNMLLAVGNDGQFERFCGVIGKPEWAKDERFATNKARVINREVLVPMISEVTRTKATVQWVDALEGKAVPCGPVNQMSDVFKDPQVQARGLRVELPPTQVDGVTTAPVYTVASPVRLSDTPPVLSSPPPALGQHTDEVLQSIGISKDTIAQLKSQAIIG